jgi:hypothetical protein
MSEVTEATNLSGENGTTNMDSNPKYLLRRLRRQVLGKKFTKEKIQRAIRLYDLEESYDSQSSEAMAKLECLFGIDIIQWPSEEGRLMMIADKVDHSLKRVLFSLGCALFPYPFVVSVLSNLLMPLRL